MSAGAVFKILTNDGKADAILMATQLLKDRICELIEMREARGFADTLPTLRDIEHSHVLHFQSKFKPFVALGYEYQNVKQQTGTQTFGGVVQFNIPQFGDFLTDAALQTIFSACSYAAAALPSIASVLGSSTGPQDAVTPGSSPVYTYSYTNSAIVLPDGSSVAGAEVVTWPSSSSASAQAVAVRRLRGTQFVNDAGQTISPYASVSDNVYYCDYPGERLLTDTKFEVNGNPLDEYDHMSYAFYRKHRLCKDKELSYCRNMGQETPQMAYTNCIGSGVRQRDTLFNGPQTPKQVQPQLNMWIKLLFWFNLDHSQALVSAAIPSGQRYITFTLANVADLVFRAPSVWVEAVLVTDYFVLGSGTGQVAAPSGSTFTLDVRYNGLGMGALPQNAGSVTSQSGWSLGSERRVLRYPVLTNGALSPPTVTALNLYVNNIFTIPEIHDIYIERIGFSLIRVHRKHIASITTAQYELLMSNFKYPIEFFTCGLRPDVNFSGPNRDTDWHLFTYNSRTQVLGSASNTSLVGNRTMYVNTYASSAYTPGYTDALVVSPFSTMGAVANKSGIQTGWVNTSPAMISGAPGTATYNSEGWNLSVAQSSTRELVTAARTIDTVGVQAHGVTLFNDIDSSFFNSYVPEVYGGGAAAKVLTSTEDVGALFINFCLYPFDKQPSGHVNVSRAREFYVRLTSSVINASVTGTFIAEASAINFLLISDGSAVLRYTT